MWSHSGRCCRHLHGVWASAAAGVDDERRQSRHPFGPLFLLAALLGGPNFVVVAILTVFAATYSMCVLFVGCTRLAMVPERFAPPAVALMLLVAIWLSKIIIASFFGWMNPLASL